MQNTAGRAHMTGRAQNQRWPEIWN